LIATEGLTGLVREARRKKLYEGVLVGTKDVQIEMLQFADDTFFLCQPLFHNILAIKAILRSFEPVSGLNEFL